MICTRLKRGQRAWLFAFLFITALPVAAGRDREEPKPPEGSTERELKIGMEAVKEVESRFKLIDDSAMLRKLSDMVKNLGAVSDRPKINYVVKIIGAPVKSKNPEADEREVNAFTLPGGFIYVTKGLLTFVQSDHELAAVLAHEIAHNAKLHALKLMAKEKKMQWVQIAALLGLVAGGSSGADLAQFSQLILVAIMNGYSVDLEQEADRFALAYLYRSPYKPVGLLTFMERLHREEERRPQFDLGIFQTHPTTDDRVAFTLRELRKLNVPINRREVLKVARPIVEPLKDTSRPAAQVKLGNVVICTLAGDTPKEAEQRAQYAADQIEKLLGADTAALLLTIRREGSQRLIMARGQTVITVSEADAKLNNESTDRLAQQWVTNLRQIRWRDIVNDSA
jgi:Zn-dependent protease with chaperone function